MKRATSVVLCWLAISVLVGLVTALSSRASSPQEKYKKVKLSPQINSPTREIIPVIY